MFRLKIFRVLAILLLFSGVGESAYAVQRFPPPEFDTDYELPPTEVAYPSCSAAEENLYSLVCYIVAIVVAIVYAHYFRSRRVLFGLAIASLLIFGFILKGCPCPVGSIQNVFHALFYREELSKLGILVPWTVIFLFAIPIVAALFYGRVFCSSVCPLGAIQELLTIFPIKLPRWLEHSLGLIRYVYLGLVVMFVAMGLPFILCRFDPYVNFFRLSGMADILWFGGILLVIGLFIGRPYCRFLCPYGAILGLCSKAAMRNVHVTPGECTKCRLCEEMCPYGAIEPPSKRPDPLERKRGPIRLLIVLLCVPAIIFSSVYIAKSTSIYFAALHPDVAIVQALRMEDESELGLLGETGTVDETVAFKKKNIANEDQYRKATAIYQQFRTACGWLGLWIGIVFSVKLVYVALRRKRTEYEVDPALCVACGRCFWYCPNQNENRVLLEDELRFLGKR